MGNKITSEASARRRIKICETCSSVGMLTILIALAVPIVNLGAPEWLMPWKWVYACGAVLYLGGRIGGSVGRGESMRLRRMRRMQSWAGVAFCVAAFFWFYSEQRFGPSGGALAILRQTILFSLVGALIEMVAAWMIYAREKKERNSASE